MFSPLKSLFFRSMRLFSSLESSNYAALSPKNLIKEICAEPVIVKNKQFQETIENTIKESLMKSFSFSQSDVLLVRMLLTYSKFEHAEYDWRSVIQYSIKNFQDKNLNIYDLALILSIYYDALRRYFDIKGREEDFFKNKQALSLKEKEYNVALSLSFKKIKQLFQAWRGKTVDEKLFYEYIVEKFFEKLGSDINFIEKQDEIIYFGKVFIGFEFEHQKFNSFFYDLLKKQMLSMNILTQIYLVLLRKQNFKFPDIFTLLLDNMNIYIKEKKPLAIKKNFEPHYLYLSPKYLKSIFVEENLEISLDLMIPDDILTNKSILDIYWIMSKNYNPKYMGHLLQMQKSLENFINDFSLKDLILFLVSCLYQALNEGENLLVNDELYKRILIQLSEKIHKDDNAWETLNIKTFGGSLFQVLKYLSVNGYNELINEKITEDVLLALGRSWIAWTRNRKVSGSEKIIRDNLKQVLKKFRKNIRYGAYIGEMYYCDMLIGEKIVIEINGDQHYNIFFKNGDVQEEKFRYISNFLLKKAFLWNKGFIVSEIHEETYMKFLYDKRKMEEFLFEYLTKLFEKNL